MTGCPSRRPISVRTYCFMLYYCHRRCNSMEPAISFGCDGLFPADLPMLGCWFGAKHCRDIWLMIPLHTARNCIQVAISSTRITVQT